MCPGVCPGSRDQRGSSSPPAISSTWELRMGRGAQHPPGTSWHQPPLMWAVEGTVLNLSLSCGRGRLLLRDGFVPLLGEMCPGRALVFGSVCSSPSARATAELLLWVLRPLYAPRVYGQLLLRARWPRGTVPPGISQPVRRTQGWLRMEPWEPAFS